MSSLVLARDAGLLVGLSAPSAGDSANSVRRITVAAIEDLKSGIRAGSSLVFNELQTLAQESNTSVRESGTFLMAQRFLLALPAHLRSPELALDEDCEVSFDWCGSGRRMLTLTLREDGRITYAARLSAYDKEYGTKQFVDAVPDRISELVEQVTSEKFCRFHYGRRGGSEIRF